jgi:cobalt-zinc-cadmium efflux system membrane fusion protein
MKQITQAPQVNCRGPQAGWAARYLPLILVSFILSFHTGCQKRNKTEPPPEAMVTTNSVSIATNSPQLTSLSVEEAGGTEKTVVSLSGRLVWNEEVTVRVFSPFAGIVRKLNVDVGQRVAKGMVLADIQSGDFAQVVADGRKAESDLRRTESVLNRERDLAEHGAAAKKDVESAEADYAAARAEQQRAAARLAIYGATTEAADHGFLLPSPLDGVLVEKNVTPGQEVRPDQMLANTPQFTAPLFTVTDPSKLWIQIDATEIDLPHLKPGSEFTFTSRAFPQKTFTGRVDIVSEYLDPATRTLKIRGTVDNRDRALKAEMFVNVNLPGDEVPGTSVPSKAVFLKGEKHYVFIEAQPGHFARQEVKIGNEQNGHVVVLAGVQPGQRVVTEGCVLLQQTLHD